MRGGQDGARWNGIGDRMGVGVSFPLHILSSPSTPLPSPLSLPPLPPTPLPESNPQSQVPTDQPVRAHEMIRRFLVPFAPLPPSASAA